jgi:hypothetical protein
MQSERLYFEVFDVPKTTVEMECAPSSNWARDIQRLYAESERTRRGACAPLLFYFLFLTSRGYSLT